jgi:hypothetical protein
MAECFAWLRLSCVQPSLPEAASGCGGLHEDAVVEVLDDGAEVDGFGVVGAVFGDLFFFHHPETEALEDFGAAAFLEGDDLAEDGGFTVGAEVLQKLEEQLARSDQTLDLGEQVEMEMRQAARRGGDFMPGIEDDPADKSPG